MAAATRSKHHGATHVQEPVESKASPIAGKVQSPPKGGATQKIDPDFEKDVAIDEFIGHRIDTENSTVDIQVKWQDGETTWESEWSLQEKVPVLVFKYWEKLDGRKAATNLDTYHVFKILKRAPPSDKSGNSQHMYQVQWVGYRPAESTWEHESKLRTITPDMLEDFETKQLAKGASEKRKSMRGPGRPRKKRRVKV
ncbi:vegetative incompatibility het-e-1 [Fusarium mundagurra]|uniref:Vegetative incompatibility het-e-1 n=1 Tax=Fusarium mundagurra TaxID=1567541 RepID=A0A8H6D4I6_9HYPO|nr:vegetative incompatibility het-e-1 [Fusarium mundagurra]